MKLDVFNLAGDNVGSESLNSAVFLKDFRPDIIKRVVDWQLAAMRQGSRKTKTVSEVSGTTKKPHSQKGSGRARQGSLRSVQMRGGGVVHGPVVRDHSYSLPKSIRSFALKSILSQKLRQGNLWLLDSFNMEIIKTNYMQKYLAGKFDNPSVLFIGDNKKYENFYKSVRNIKHTKLLNVAGVNVYDILRFQEIVFNVEDLKELQNRLSR